MALERYLLKEYFYDIPPIPVSYGNKDEMCGVYGSFCFEAGDDYDEEAVEDIPGYRVRYVTLPGVAAGYTEYESEPPFMEPLMNPELSILINPSIRKDPCKLVAVMMHELAHYYCWYVGYDYSDESSEFLAFLKERGLPTNYDDYAWDREEKRWVDMYDYGRMEPYLMGFTAKVRG